MFVFPTSKAVTASPRLLADLESAIWGLSDPHVQYSGAGLNIGLSIGSKWRDFYFLEIGARAYAILLYWSPTRRETTSFSASFHYPPWLLYELPLQT